MKPNRIVRLGIVVLVAVAVAGVLRLKQAESPSPLDGPPVSVRSVASAEPSLPPGRQPADIPLPKMLDLGADKCIPCKKMAPMLVALREDFAGRFDVVFIDVWKNREAAVPYGIKVIPTQIFFDEQGRELFRHQGFFSRDDILAKWSELGYVFAAPPGTDAG